MPALEFAICEKHSLAKVVCTEAIHLVRITLSCLGGGKLLVLFLLLLLLLIVVGVSQCFFLPFYLLHFPQGDLDRNLPAERCIVVDG